MLSDKEIIEKSLNFLIVDYNFKYEYLTPYCNNEEYYIFRKQDSCFTYYQWNEMKEYKFTVVFDQEFKEIRLFERYPQELELFRKNHTGIKWIFKDYREDYWKMIADIIKKEIQSTGFLFGIKI